MRKGGQCYRTHSREPRVAFLIQIVCCADSIFSQLGGAEPPVGVRGSGTAASFSRSHFSHSIPSDSHDVAVAIEASGASSVWLQECTFTDDHEGHPLGASGTSARFFSDRQLQVWASGEAMPRASESLHATPQSPQFLNSSNPWLLSVQQV